jgi:hypothetical protein
MLRALVVLLLLANALVLAWSLGALDGLLGRRPDADREPERLQRQVNPELVKLLPPPGAKGASAPGSTASAASAAAASSTVVAVAASAAGTSVCLEAGPLPAAAMAGAEKAMLAAGVAAGSWTTTAAAAKGVYLIYMGRYEDEEALQRKLEELKRRRIDAHPVRHAELQPGIEVARFEDKDEADDALARLSQRGLRTARVLTLVPPSAQQMLRIAAVEPARVDTLAALKLSPGVGGFVACRPAAARPDPAASPAMIRTSAAAEAPARSASPPRRAASAPDRAPASQAASAARAASSSSAGLP